MPKETRQFLNKQGYALRKLNRDKAKELVHNRTGAYRKGFRKGKIYHFKGDKNSTAIRVYNNTPGAGAIEVGRAYRKADGSTQFVEGKHVMEQAAKAFEPEYAAALDDFMDELVNSI